MRRVVLLAFLLGITFSLSNDIISVTFYDYYAAIRQYCYSGHCSYTYTYTLQPYYIYKNGYGYWMGGSWQKEVVDGGRGVIYKSTRVPDIYIEHYYYVPPGNENWIRVITYFENKGTSTVTLKMRYRDYFYNSKWSTGCTDCRHRFKTSDGDAAWEKTDNWFWIDDIQDGSYPLKLILAKDSSLNFAYTYSYGANYTTYSYRNVYWDIQFTLEPGESASIIQFIVISDSPTDAQAEMNLIEEAIENGDITSKYFADLMMTLEKRKYLRNIVNFETEFPLPPILKIEKLISNTTVYTWENLTVTLNVTVEKPEKMPENRTYNFIKLRFYDYFPTSFGFIGIEEEGVKKIAVVVRKFENGTEIFEDTLYFPISIEGDYYKISIEPNTPDLLNIFKLDLNQTMELSYVIIPKIAGMFTLPSAVLTYMINETYIGG